LRPTVPFSRRGFLGGAGALLIAARLQALGGLDAAGAAPLPADPFTLGVASGDPLPTSVILWTRLAPDPTNGGGMPPDDVPVDWEVATDAAFTDVVASGTEPAVAALAHSVHVDAGGLDPDQWYFYRFAAGGFTSPVGRTRTTPAADSETPLRLGAASCQNWRAGYYTAHAHLAQEGCDVIVFLGDYIYESGGSGPVRAHNGGEITTLADYRNRYGLYKGDPNLQAAHAACPWVPIWDDHEVDNNYAGSFAADGAPEATFLERRAAAYRAWFEHQPVRLDAPTGPDHVIYRRFDWGRVARVHLPDTRQYRSDQACADGLKLPCAGFDDPARTLLGATQEAWLLDSFTTSPARWDVFAQQIVFAAMPIGNLVNMDQWDGYPAQRSRVWPVLQTRPNVVVLSGDIHFNGLANLHEDLDDATTPRHGTELVVGSISSQFTSAPADVVEQLIEMLPWWDHVNAAERGYAVVDLTMAAMHGELRVVSTALETEATVRTDATVDVDAVDEPPPPTSTTTTSTTSTSTTTTTPSTSTTTPSSSTTTSTTSTTPDPTGSSTSTTTVDAPSTSTSTSPSTTAPVAAAEPATAVAVSPRFAG